MVGELAAAHPLSQSFNLEVWSEGIRQGLACQEVPKSASSSDCLHCVISRCFLITGQDVIINFLLMVDYINLVTQCQRIKLDTGFSLSQIYRDFVVPMGRKISLRAFQKWHSAGTKFAALAGGGTVYVLVLIAGLGLRISIASMTGQGPWDLANTLRCPDKCRMIIGRVIPAVHAIQRVLPLTIESLFPTNIFALHQLPKDVGFGSSDRFFDWIVFNNFTLVPRSFEWNVESVSGEASTSSGSTTSAPLPCSLLTDRMLERLAPQAEDVQMEGDACYPPASVIPHTLLEDSQAVASDH
ncbi:hypothetical protein EV702DRAFT_450026 [Suillus placidus]|uniref:Uncharacterized protein n=1 Tax=Suillus placidus TaxID=48579 RepID=A0A9P7D1M5_9AGAM|nr:hypothetical protein EV702DRAFT_450026 [Suillus placidus]